MAWTYADYESASTTPAGKLSRLLLHITEVTQALSAQVSADGKSRDPSLLNDHLTRLNARRMELEEQVSTRANGNFGRFRMGGVGGLRS